MEALVCEAEAMQVCRREIGRKQYVRKLQSLATLLPRAIMTTLDEVGEVGWEQVDWQDGFTILHWFAKHPRDSSFKMKNLYGLVLVTPLVPSNSLDAKDSKGYRAIDYARDQARVDATWKPIRDALDKVRARRCAQPVTPYVTPLSTPRGHHEANAGKEAARGRPSELVAAQVSEALERQELTRPSIYEGTPLRTVTTTSPAAASQAGRDNRYDVHSNARGPSPSSARRLETGTCEPKTASPRLTCEVIVAPVLAEQIGRGAMSSHHEVPSAPLQRLQPGQGRDSSPRSSGRPLLPPLDTASALTASEQSTPHVRADSTKEASAWASRRGAPPSATQSHCAAMKDLDRDRGAELSQGFDTRGGSPNVQGGASSYVDDESGDETMFTFAKGEVRKFKTPGFGDDDE